MDASDGPKDPDGDGVKNGKDDGPRDDDGTCDEDGSGMAVGLGDVVGCFVGETDDETDGDSEGFSFNGTSLKHVPSQPRDLHPEKISLLHL